MQYVQPWLLAIRPKTLPAAVGPVLVGSALALAEGRFAALPASAALGVALLLQIAVNLANDYFDGVQGIDSPERLGPTRVTQSGLIPAEKVRTAIFAVLAPAVLLGIYLLFKSGWPVVVIGLASILAALGYSGGPFPLASHGLGDVFVFIFFGLVAVGGTYYVQTSHMTAFVLGAATAVGLLITAILVVNNLRDIHTDKKTGKITLAVVLGERGTKIEYILLLLGAYAMLPLLWMMVMRSSVWVFLPMLSLPWAVRIAVAVWTGPIDASLNVALARTASLSFCYSVLLSLGIVTM